MHECDRRQTDRPRYTKMCGYRFTLERFCLITPKPVESIAIAMHTQTIKCMSDKLSVQLPETLMSMVDNCTRTTITANFILQNTPAQTISLSLLLQQFYKTMVLYSDFRTERIRSGVKRTTITDAVAAVFTEQLVASNRPKFNTKYQL